MTNVPNEMSAAEPDITDVDSAIEAKRPSVEIDQLLHVARELDDEAVSPPCSEAEVVRDAAAEIERLRAENDELQLVVDGLQSVINCCKAEGVL